MPDVFELRFRGFVAARDRHKLELDEIGPDSSEWSIDPINTQLVRRGGSKIIEDTIGAVVGLFDTDFDGRAEAAGSLHSPSFTTDYSSPCYLYTNETTKKGAFGWIDRNQAGAVASHKQIGKNFLAAASGGTHYPDVSAAIHLKFTPMWFENSTTPLGRWINTTQRELSAAGARNFIEVGKRIYLPNAQGTPLYWDKYDNKDGDEGTENVHVFPWGNLMPLHTPRAKTTAAGGTGDNNWKDGDSFYVSVQFEYEDGSLSVPFIPRPAGSPTAATSDTAAGVTAAVTLAVAGTTYDTRNGHVIVGTIGGTAFFKSITWSDIPYGPDGVKYVRLLRSDKTNLASTSTPMAADPLTLHQIVKLPNGTVSYVDTGADDGTLVPDQRITDSLLSIWAPRCQYAIGADGRVVLGGDIQINPACIVIAPISVSNAVGSAADANVVDTSAVGTVQCFVKCSTTTLTLRRVEGLTPSASIGDMTIALANVTLQEVVDAINATTVVQTGGAVATHRARWGAQLVPGVDGALLASKLADTTGGNWFGDDHQITGGGSGNFRCPFTTYPGILYFSQSYLATLKKDTQSILMSSASPTVPGGNANSFFSDKSTNWKAPPSAKAGRLMGLAPLTGKGGVVCVAFYEKGWYVLRNTTAGGSGQDADYRLVSLDELDGCISHRAVGAGPGVVFGFSKQGLSLTDGDNKVLITRDLWDVKRQKGLFAQELVKAIAAAAAGTQDHYLAAKLLDSKLVITYRSDNTLAYANRRVEYEFGEGADSLGLGGMLRQSDTGRPAPYGWSAPILTQRVSVMGQWEDASGSHNFGCNEVAAGSTGDGRIDEIDTGITDDAGGYGSAAGSAYTSNAYTATIPAPLHKFINLLSLALRYIKNGTGLSVTVYGDGPTLQGSRSDSATLTVGSSGTNLYGEMQSNPRGVVRSSYSCVEFKITDDGTGSTAPVVEALDVQYDLSERTVVT